MRNYTIFDLPLTNVMQSYFLGRTLAAEAIGMDLESVDGIRVLPYFELFEESGNYDICERRFFDRDRSWSGGELLQRTVQERADISFHQS
jgi:hypothetical protein